MALAELVVRAVAVLVTLHWLTSDFVIDGISVIALFARADSLMVFRVAFRVPSAENETVARILAFGLTVSVLKTSGRVVAIVIRTAAKLLDAYAVLAELEVRATTVRSAGRLAQFINAQLISDAVAGASTFGCIEKSLLIFFFISPNIQWLLTCADAVVTFSSRGTLGVGTAILNGDASEVRVSREAGLTSAYSDVVGCEASGSLSADIG